MIDKNSRIPIYIQLENILLEDLKNEEYVPGTMIPSENELVKKYEISRMTAKKAIDALVLKGYLERIQGRGTFVLEKEEKIELPLNKFRGFTEGVREKGYLPKTKVISLEKIKANKEISELLNINKGDYIWHMERLRQVDETPAVFEETYMSFNILPDLKLENLVKSKYEYIESLGLEITESDREIVAEIPTDYVATHLRLKRNEPLILANCLTKLKDGRVLEYSKIYYNQRKYKFKLLAELNKR